MWTQLTKHKISLLVKRFPDSYVEAGLGDAWCEWLLCKCEFLCYTILASHELFCKVEASASKLTVLGPQWMSSTDHKWLSFDGVLDFLTLSIGAKYEDIADPVFDSPKTPARIVNMLHFHKIRAVVHRRILCLSQMVFLRSSRWACSRRVDIPHVQGH